MKLLILTAVAVALSLSNISFATGFFQNTDGSVTAPDGLIWYPTIRNGAGAIFPMGYYQSVRCCNGPRAEGYPDSCPFGSGGKYLPSIPEFKTLREQLGYGSPQGYDPLQVPDLKGQLVFWSSTFLAASANSAWYYFGSSGDVQYTYTQDKLSARCVGR